MHRYEKPIYKIAAGIGLVTMTLFTAGSAAATQLYNGVPVNGLSARGGEELHFSLEVPSGASNLELSILGGTGDADLYVRFGSPPTRSTYDDLSNSLGNNDTCTLPSATPGTWYVMLYAYKAFSGVSLVGRHDPAVTQLQNDVPLDGLSAGEEEELGFFLEVPGGADNLELSISGGTGDADLYVKLGSPPTILDSDYSSTLSGNDDACPLPATAGTWHVMVYAYNAFSGVSLVGRYDTPNLYSYMVAGIAKAAGAGGSYWMSYLSVANYTDSLANLTLIYRYGSGSISRTLSLGPHDTVGWNDVVASLFEASVGAGAVEVQSDQPVSVQARTFNDTANGTFGQYLPGVSVSEMISDDLRGFLGQLRNTSVHRTNVGFVNPGALSCTARVQLYDITGTQIGGSVTQAVPAGSWKQISDIFARTGAGTTDLAYATVDVMTSGCSLWAYASVIDGESGDPFTIPVTMLE